MTTPIMNGRAAGPAEGEIYERSPEVATQRLTRPLTVRWWRVAEGATLGIVCWIMVMTLGIPWVFHVGGLDGLVPSAIVGALLGASRWRAVPLAATMALALVFVAVTYTPIIAGPARSLVRSDPLPARADAIVVLSAGVNNDGTILPQAMDRLLKGIELLERGVAPLLVLSREAYIIDGQLVTSRKDQERIVSLVPGGLSRTIVSGVTHSTHDEAVRTLALFRARQWARVVVVTSPFHSRRACATFEHIGMQVSCAPSESREIAVSQIQVPDDRLKAFQLWIYELAGTIRYRQLGWI